METRYAIGIDLGTTNSVLSYVDLKQTQHGSKVLDIPQWDQAGSLVLNKELPSFAYCPPLAELPRFVDEQGGAPEPVNNWIPGLHSRNQMAFNPGRVIHSAKSWLCHNDIDRTSAILPWQSEEIGQAEKLSPVAASALYLRWLQQAWDRTMLPNHPDALFAHQHIVITVPASFDEAAQELTLLAASTAGYPQQLRLIEEPQAAFYFWLGKDQHLSELHDLLKATPRTAIQVLVCDIGGGTTDLSLFEACADKSSETGLSLKRLAVSDHLLLGGDNIDLAVAHLLEQKLTQGKKKLTGRQWNQLLVQARDLKERILGDEESLSTIDNDSNFSITLSGSGAGMFASTLSTSISAAEIHHCILDGFFPLCDALDRPQNNAPDVKEWGLPYASDSAISRHLAAFLDNQHVDAILFNGGSVTPLLLRDRLHQLICSWQSDAPPVVLHNEAISMAVARGAARYGWILQQQKTENRIAGGHAHALYLEAVSGKKKKERSLVCVLPKGIEAGNTIRINQAEFDLIVNQPAQFQCYYSARRNQDLAGAIIAWNNNDFHPLPPLHTAIHLAENRPAVANNRLRVTLEATLNELGLLQLYCVEKDGDERWRLDFNLRKGVEENTVETPERTPFEPDTKARLASPFIQAVFAKKKDPNLPEIKPKQLIKQLEQHLGSRESWSSTTLRSLWPELATSMTRKTRSVEHEVAWLYLAGFTLRPGYGVQLDDSRIEELWRLFQLGMSFPKEKRIQSHWYLLWRRIAGGLNSSRQEQILNKIIPTLRSSGDLIPEMVYLAGALERIAPETKVELIRLFSQTLLKERTRHKAPYIWALGRLLSRTPLYAGANSIVHPRHVTTLFDNVAQRDWRSDPWKGLIGLFALAARCTEQRDIDIDDETRRKISAKLREAKASIALIRPIESFVAISNEDREIQFGEALPAGLILINRP